MNFWMKNTEKEQFRLPVTPSNFEVSVANKNTTVNVVQMGDINLLGKTGLRTVSLSCFFPSQDYHFSKAERQDPEYYISLIEKWRKSNTLIRFIIKDTINLLCTVESFTWGMRDGTTDVYYTLSLKEYRQISGKKRQEKTIKATSHKVSKGDTLSKIAKKYYGTDGSSYRELIFKNNKKILSSKTNLSKAVGKKISIPATKIVSWK